MGQRRRNLAFTLLALLAFSLAAQAAQQTSHHLSSLSTPLPRALQDRLSPLSRQQELYYGMLIKRGGLQAMNESVLYQFCKTAKLLCSASLQRSIWGHAGGAETASLSFHTNSLFTKWTARKKKPSASVSKSAANDQDQTDAAIGVFEQWRDDSTEIKMAAKPAGAKQYFTEKDLMIGTQLVLPGFLYQSVSDNVSNAELKPSFLPASIASNLPPLNLQHLTDILQLLHIPPDLNIVKKMEETLKSCSGALIESGTGKKKDDDDDDKDDDDDNDNDNDDDDNDDNNDDDNGGDNDGDGNDDDDDDDDDNGNDNDNDNDDDNDDDGSTLMGLAKKKKKKKKDDDDDNNNSIVSSCVTSLEAMLKFVCSTLSAPVKKVQALTNSEVVGSEGGTVMIVQVTEVAAGHDTVDCHELMFPFKVMGCHRIKDSKAMVVRVAEEGGKDMDLLVACHKNTTLFNPHHEAFSQLHSSPGQTEICHFLPNTDIMWIPL